LILRLMHKLMAGLRQDHQKVFMFLFCIKLTNHEERRLGNIKSLIMEKVEFLFNGLQIYNGDLLALNYEQSDFIRDANWDNIKHEL
jgi:hypothetical protein